MAISAYTLFPDIYLHIFQREAIFEEMVNPKRWWKNPQKWKGLVDHSFIYHRFKASLGQVKYPQGINIPSCRPNRIMAEASVTREAGFFQRVFW